MAEESDSDRAAGRGHALFHFALPGRAPQVMRAGATEPEPGLLVADECPLLPWETMVAQLCPATVVRDPPGDGVHCAFESEARPTGNYPGWLSERSFSLDATARKAILAGLNEDR
jgi:hypothetical protein